MKVYISADMEGISGVVCRDQTHKEGGDWERSRALMTREVNAAVEGALNGGAHEVLVNDSHASMRNILIEELHPEARLISGWPKVMSMVEGLDETCDAAFFVGYHARQGFRGVLSHTYTGYVLEYRVNGRAYGEVGMNAAAAGVYDVPVVLVTGDDSATREAADLLPGVETVTVKEHISRTAARLLHPGKCQELIRAAAKRALERKGDMVPFRIEGPVEIQIKFANTGHADAAMLMPGAHRADDLSVAYGGPDYLTALRGALTLIHLAGK